MVWYGSDWLYCGDAEKYACPTPPDFFTPLLWLFIFISIAYTAVYATTKLIKKKRKGEKV